MATITLTAKQNAKAASTVRLCDRIEGTNGRYYFVHKGMDYTGRLVARGTRLLDIQPY